MTEENKNTTNKNTTIETKTEENKNNNNCSSLLSRIGSAATTILLIVATLMIIIESITMMIGDSKDNIEPEKPITLESRYLGVNGVGLHQQFSAEKDFPDLDIKDEEDMKNNKDAIVAKAIETDIYFYDLKFTPLSHDLIIHINAEVTQDMSVLSDNFKVFDASPFDHSHVEIGIIYQFTTINITHYDFVTVDDGNYILQRGTIEVI